MTTSVDAVVRRAVIENIVTMLLFAADVRHRGQRPDQRRYAVRCSRWFCGEMTWLFR